MCFTMGASLVLSAVSFGLAAYEYRQFANWQYSVGIAYWGVMEFLQVVQHMYAARPEDDYAMCKNPINQQLTDLGTIHILFQPAFTSILMMSMYRRHDIEARIIGDFLFRLCVAGALWFPFNTWASALMGVDPDMLPPATKECPNYQWLYEGYDGFLKQTTPNVPGKPCVYYAPTQTGHLAWVIPMFKQTYLLPSANVHFFMFFFPYIVMFNKPAIPACAIIFWLTGPYLAKTLTPSVNEQAAIWCFYSVLQAVFFTIVVRWQGLYKKPVPARIHHPGTRGEQPLTYIRYDIASKDPSFNDNGNGTYTNGNGNGTYTNGNGAALPLEDPKHF